MNTQSSFPSYHVKGVSKELDSLDIGHFSLIPVYFQEQLLLNERNYVRLCPLGTPLASAKDNQSSQPGELPPELLTEPDVNLSAHPAPIVQPQA